MGVLHGNPFLLASGTATEPAVPLQRSVRLRASNSAYFNRTQTTTTNSVKCTFSGWVKRGTLGVLQVVFGGYTGTDADTQLYFDTTNQLKFTSRITNVNGAAFEWVGESAAVFRDPSAWYHIVVTVDTSTAQATNNAYYTVYVNNVAQTFTTVSGASLVSAATVQNRNTCWNVSGYSATLGRQRTNYFDGYLTEVYFIDGQALTPSSFGGYNAGTNVWEVRKYTGAYGTNGFYLPFTNPASIGADGSPNGNNWTANGIQTSNSALTTYDSMLDVPTNTGSNNANFAVWNTLSQVYATAKGTLADGNLKYTVTPTVGGTQEYIEATIQCSGKTYVELQLGLVGTGGSFAITGGIAQTVGTNYSYNSVEFSYTYSGSGTPNGLNSRTNGGGGTTISSFTPANNDIYGFAIDADTGKVWVSRNNGTWIGGGDPVAGTTPTYTFNTLAYPLNVFTRGREQGNNVVANFGQRPFTYTVPSGFKALNTYNLPEPTIPRGDKYFKQYLYTGNGGGLQVGEIQKPASLFNLDRSIRIRAAQNAYFSRLPTVNGNGQKFTISTWVKRGEIGAGWTDTIFTGRTGTNFPELDLVFASDVLHLQAYTTGAALLMSVDTVNTYRDPSMWYHIVLAFDTTQTTPADRVKVYVNGVAQTIAAGATYPSPNLVLTANQTVTQYIGSSPANTAWGDLYFADYYMIDGYQLTPTSFGAFDGNNYWTPKAYTGTYGTNGFHLEFEDYSNNTATTIGKDTSGQGNNWTPTGISVTPGITNDSLLDVPTLTSANNANFCVLNPLAANTTLTPTQGNLYLGLNASNNFGCVATMGVASGKWYWEVKPGDPFCMIGITSLSYLPANVYPGQVNTLAKTYYGGSGQKFDNGTQTAYGATYTTTNIMGIALDMDAGTLTFYKDNTSQGVAFTGLTGTYFPVLGSPNSYAAGYINFGQRSFENTTTWATLSAAGYKSINSFNVAEVTGDVETPDLVWIKSRSAGTHHALFNSVSGVGKYLQSSGTAIETTDVNSLVQFNKNGFLLGNAAIVNASTATFVASAWKKGAPQGVDIVSFTNTASSASFNHSLGVTPSMIILKGLGATAANWTVFHKSLANMTTAYLNLNTTAIAGTLGTAVPAPTSTTFGSSSAAIPASQSSIAYLFAEKEGYSKFGSYISNNATDGPFVYTGFRPRWLIVKRALALSGSTGGWFMYDAARNTYNVMDKYLFAEGAAGDGTLGVFDFTSNGFKIRSNNVHVNTTSGDTYIYMAFAENPFKYALAR